MFGTNVYVKYNPLHISIHLSIYMSIWTWNDFQIRTLYSTDMYPQTAKQNRVLFRHTVKSFPKNYFQRNWIKRNYCVGCCL